MDTKLIAYLNFDGKVAEAMRFYQSIFGGELEMQTFAEAGVGDTDDVKDRIVHAQLSAEGFTLMATDCQPKDSATLVMGNSVGLSLMGTDEDRLTRYFNTLAEGGKIEMPLGKQFWGDTFGACEDKFGIHWMVNISVAPEA